MTILKDKLGTWVNQFSQPGLDLFDARVKQVDYVILKWGLNGKGIGGANSGVYERQATSLDKPWLAERMAEDGAGDQFGPSRAAKYADQLAAQANQPGCIGAVINLEEADGGWHLDHGGGTRRLIWDFRTKAPGKPLFASLDTRGNRPNYLYQQICAELCDGVMPMIYPKAFGLPAPAAFASALTPLMRQRWAGKDILPTFQTYDLADVPSQVAEIQRLYAAGVIQGANSYTLSHATPAQWDASLLFDPSAPVAPGAPPDVAAALVALRKLWVEGWHAIEQRGTIQEARAFADFWQKLTGS